MNKELVFIVSGTVHGLVGKYVVTHDMRAEFGVHEDSSNITYAVRSYEFNLDTPKIVDSENIQVIHRDDVGDSIDMNTILAQNIIFGLACYEEDRSLNIVNNDSGSILALMNLQGVQKHMVFIDGNKENSVIRVFKSASCKGIIGTNYMDTYSIVFNYFEIREGDDFNLYDIGVLRVGILIPMFSNLDCFMYISINNGEVIKLDRYITL